MTTSTVEAPARAPVPRVHPGGRQPGQAGGRAFHHRHEPRPPAGGGSGNVNHFLKKFAGQYARPVRRLTQRALDLVVHHDWPGNVRQLENRIEQGVIFGQGEARTCRTFAACSRTCPHRSRSRTRTARFIGLSLRSLRYKLKAYQQKRQALGPLTPQNSS